MAMRPPAARKEAKLEQVLQLFCEISKGNEAFIGRTVEKQELSSHSSLRNKGMVGQRLCA